MIINKTVFTRWRIGYHDWGVGPAVERVVWGWLLMWDLKDEEGVHSSHRDMAEPRGRSSEARWPDLKENETKRGRNWGQITLGHLGCGKDLGFMPSLMETHWRVWRWSVCVYVCVCVCVCGHIWFAFCKHHSGCFVGNSEERIELGRKIRGRAKRIARPRWWLWR